MYRWLSVVYKQMLKISNIDNIVKFHFSLNFGPEPNITTFPVVSSVLKKVKLREICSKFNSSKVVLSIHYYPDRHCCK